MYTSIHVVCLSVGLPVRPSVRPSVCTYVCFYTKLFDKQDNFGFGIVRMQFYCSNVPSKMFYRSIGAGFLRISRATRKIEDLSRTCK